MWTEEKITALEPRALSQLIENAAKAAGSQAELTLRMAEAEQKRRLSSRAREKNNKQRKRAWLPSGPLSVGMTQTLFDEDGMILAEVTKADTHPNPRRENYNLKILGAPIGWFERIDEARRAAERRLESEHR